IRLLPEASGHAPGEPGIPPTWTSSAKDIVGCALGPARLWFTMGFGIVNEVYYPRVDIPQIRDLGFIVAGPDGFWSEVKRNANHGWQDFERNSTTTRQHSTAEPGNVALVGELPRRAVLALGFGNSREAAATLAISSAVQPFENVLQHQIADWEAWQARGSER